MALTAATIDRHSMGDLTLHIVSFASVSSAGDTWTSGLPNIVSAWASSATASSWGCACSFVSSTGVVTVQPGAAASKVELYVLSQT